MVVIFKSFPIWFVCWFLNDKEILWSMNYTDYFQCMLMKYKNEKIQVQWGYQDQLQFDFVWNLHPREGLYFFKTLSFLSLFKLVFQSLSTFSLMIIKVKLWVNKCSIVVYVPYFNGGWNRPVISIRISSWRPFPPSFVHKKLHKPVCFSY